MPSSVEAAQPDLETWVAQAVSEALLGTRWTILATLYRQHLAKLALVNVSEAHHQKVTTESL